MGTPTIKQLFNLIYPVGSVYISVSSTNPSTLFGGTWERLKDRFLLGVGDSYTTANTTGGSKNKTIAVANLPSHNHSFAGSAHSHAVGTLKAASDGEHNHYSTSHGEGYNAMCYKTGTAQRGKLDRTGNYFTWSSDVQDNLQSSQTTTQSGEHTHTLSGSTANATQGGTIGNTGNGTALDIMPPYLTVYMWKRTA